MKKTLFILCLVLISLSGYNQEIPRGANLITFESDSLKDFDLFKQCVMVLKNEGYSFDQIDKDFYICSTKPIKPNRIELEYRIEISVSGNKAELRSFVKNLTTFSSYSGGLGHKTENAWERGAIRSLGTSMWRYGWDKQIEIAEKIFETNKGTFFFIKEEI